MSQLDIQTDTEGRIIALSGNFTKWTNSNGDADHYAPDAVTITVPENMEAHISASMTVDDWGYIDISPISGEGSTIRAINLTSEVASPGPRGGHVRWSGQTNEAIVLQPGQYSIIVRQDNAPYREAYANEAGTNVSFCQASVTIEYVAILAPMRKNLLTRDRAIEWLRAYEQVSYPSIPTESTYEKIVDEDGKSQIKLDSNEKPIVTKSGIWHYVGGSLFDEHFEEEKNNIPIKDRDYYNSCALRVTCALHTLNVDYTGASGALSWFKNLSHVTNNVVILSSSNMTKFIRSLFGEPTYTSKASYLAEQQTGDIIIHGGKGINSNGNPYNHVGISIDDNDVISNGITSDIWVLNRMWRCKFFSVKSLSLRQNTFAS